MPPNWELSRAVIGELAERWDGRAACAPANILGFMYLVFVYFHFSFFHFHFFEVVKLNWRACRQVGRACCVRACKHIRFNVFYVFCICVFSSLLSYKVGLGL